MRLRRHKYNAHPTIYNGVRYASKAEAQRAAILDRLVEYGNLRWWIGQPLFRLGCPENTYRPDFLVVSEDSGIWVEDVKGVETATFRRNVKLWRNYGPCPLLILFASRGKSAEWIYPIGFSPSGGSGVSKEAPGLSCDGVAR